MAVAVMTAEEILGQKGGELHWVDIDSTIHDALTLMVEHKIGSVLVKEGTRIVGIWTERDLMLNRLVPGFDPQTARVGDHMTTGLKFAPHTDSVYDLMDKYLGLRIRHLLIEKDDEFIGLLSVGDVCKATLHEKTRELEELRTAVNWEYYEEWQHK